MALNTVGQSPLGVFIESPLGVRTAGVAGKDLYFACTNDSVWVYSTAQDTWTQLTSGTANAQPQKVVLYGGSVWGVQQLLASGAEGSALVKWNGKSSGWAAWSQVDPGFGYSDLQAFDMIVYQSKLFVFFGNRPVTTYIPIVGSYDSATDTWTEHTESSWVTTTALSVMQNGYKLVASGDTALYINVPNGSGGITQWAGGSSWTSAAGFMQYSGRPTDFVINGATFYGHGNIDDGEIDNDQGNYATSTGGSWTRIDYNYISAYSLNEWAQVWDKTMAVMGGVTYAATLHLVEGEATVYSGLTTLTPSTYTQRLEFADLGSVTYDSTDASVRAMVPVLVDGSNKLLVGGDFTHIDGSAITRNLVLIDPLDYSYTEVQNVGSGPVDIEGVMVTTLEGSPPVLAPQDDVEIDTTPNYSLQLTLLSGTATGWAVGGVRSSSNSSAQLIEISSTGLLTWAAPTASAGADSSPYTITVVAGNAGGYDTISFQLTVT